MLKVEVVHKKGGTTAFIFEARSNTEEGLQELDETYSAMLGSRPRRGGYLQSNRFEIEVRDEEPNEN